MLTSWRLIDRESEETVVETLELAAGFWSRLVGLQFRRELHIGHGLLLVPCSSIHTCFVRFAIDVVAIDREGRVLSVRRGVRPWRAVWPPGGTYAVLELPVGTTRIEVGRQVAILGPDGAIIPKLLKGLHLAAA